MYGAPMRMSRSKMEATSSLTQGATVGKSGEVMRHGRFNFLLMITVMYLCDDHYSFSAKFHTNKFTCNLSSADLLSHQSLRKSSKVEIG